MPDGWPASAGAHEALDFTPWLAAQLDLLGEAIGLRLELTAHTKRIFDELHADRASIEAELGDVPDAQWPWYRQGRLTYSSINPSREGAKS